MLKFLIERLDYLISLCQRTDNRIAKKCFYDQAFGAVQYHGTLFPSEYADVESLWNDYRVRFEELVYDLNKS